MLTFISIILIIASVLLVIAVLLQPGKGQGLAAGMGGLSGQFTSMFGTRRATDFLSKLTIGFAIGIMALSLIANIWFVGVEQDIRKPLTEGADLPATNQNPLAPPQVPQQPGN